MWFLRRDSSFGPSVDRTFFVFFPWGGLWGGGGGLFEGGTCLIILASKGALIRRGALI